MKRYNITVNGKAYDVAVEELSADAAPVAVAAPVASAPAPAASPAPAAPVADGTKVTAPMPGTIVSVKVNVGDKVEAGTLVAVLEAMKMENEIFAPVDGTLGAVNVSKGQNVESGTVLTTIA